MGSKLEEGGALSSKKAGQTPGAGAYEPVPIFKSEGYTKFGSARRPGIYNERNAKFVPSPDKYLPSTSFTARSAARYSFGTSKRPKTQGNATTNVPGPGAYSIP